MGPGLEEVWESQVDVQNLAATFHVIGPYFSGDTCQFLALGLPYCPTTGTGPGGPPQIKGWQAAIPTGKTTLAGSIFAFDPAFLGGVFVG